MGKIIHGFRQSTPDSDGYPDSAQILNSDTGNMLVYAEAHFRTNPNRINPHTGQSWQDSYAQIAPTGPQGIPWACVETPKHGKCIALNGEGPVATIAPDPNNGGKMFALAVLIHCGYSDTWPGSAACQTVEPADWAAFISWFTLGETGIYILTDETGGDPEATTIQNA